MHAVSIMTVVVVVVVVVVEQHPLLSFRQKFHIPRLLFMTSLLYLHHSVLQESRRRYKAAREERERMMEGFEKQFEKLDKSQQAKMDAFISEEEKVLSEFEKSALAARKAQDTVETLSKELVTGGVAQLMLQFDVIKVSSK